MQLHIHQPSNFRLFFPRRLFRQSFLSSLRHPLNTYPCFQHAASAFWKRLIRSHVYPEHTLRSLSRPALHCSDQCCSHSPTLAHNRALTSASTLQVSATSCSSPSFSEPSRTLVSNTLRKVSASFGSRTRPFQALAKVHRLISSLLSDSRHFTE